MRCCRMRRRSTRWRRRPTAQARQFGYNNDFLGYLPIDGRADHGLLVVNHEYTNEELMFPGQRLFGWARILYQDIDSKDLVGVEMMAHGGSVIEVKKAGRQMAGGRRTRNTRGASRPTPRCASPARRRARAHEDHGRSDRHARARHAQQLRRRHHAVGHVALVRGEHQLLTSLARPL